MITVIDENGIKKEFSHPIGINLLDFLRKHNYFVSANCAGNGKCGKCKVRLLSGKVLDESPDKDGNILSCKAKVIEDICIELYPTTKTSFTEFEEYKTDSKKEGLGVALDIGTTTLCACLVDLKSGEVLKKHSCLNPQSVYGADVLNRIKACNEGNLHRLQSLILEKTRQIIEEFADNRLIGELFVSANTTMLHIFLGVDPSPIGTYPFSPVFTSAQVLDGKTLSLPVKKVYVLPSVSGFIGSDVTAGVLACKMFESQKTQLLIDVGTNGEIILCHQGKLFATSTATGPALEGASIECGTIGVSGAINKVFIENGELKYCTVNSATPVGICGSGLIDLVAVLLGEKIIDEYGLLQKNDSPLCQNLVEDKFYITKTVYLSQKDIRQYQLAKAAICAGIETLLNECGVLLEEIQTTFISGGLGFFMNVENAWLTGLLPKQLAKTAKTIGNSSLAGARLCLLDCQNEKKIDEIATSTKIIELSLSSLFQELYVEKMLF